MASPPQFRVKQLAVDMKRWQRTARRMAGYARQQRDRAWAVVRALDYATAHAGRLMGEVSALRRQLQEVVAKYDAWLVDLDLDNGSEGLDQAIENAKQLLQNTR